MAETTATTEDATHPPEDVSPSAPLGVKALCVLWALVGILMVIFGALGVIGGSAFALLFLILGSLNLAMVYGLWTMESWGWTLAMVILSLSILSNLLNVFGVFNTATGGSGGAGFAVVITAGILVYIYQQRDLYRAAGAS